MDRSVRESAFVQQLEIQAEAVGEGLLAASDHDGREEQVALVDQASAERLGGELGAADGQVTTRRR